MTKTLNKISPYLNIMTFAPNSISSGLNKITSAPNRVLSLPNIIMIPLKSLLVSLNIV